ncbi:MAG: mechanosensitive ion channel family protein, partial [Verrucomicrobiota bacterium]
MKRGVGWLMFWFCFGMTATFAQDAEQVVTNQPAASSGPNLDSPRSTMFSFIHAMNRTVTDNLAWDEALACLDFGRLDYNTLEQRERATYLLGVLNRIERVEERYLWGPDDLEGKPNRFPYFPNEERHSHISQWIRDLSDIELIQRGDGTWVFSEATLQQISTLYGSMEQLERRAGRDERLLNPSLWVRSKIPEPLKKKIITFEIWQFVGLFVVILLGVVVDVFVRFFLKTSVKRFIERRGGSARMETISLAVRPVGLLAGALLCYGLLRLLGFAGVVESILLGAARVFATIAGAWVAWRGVDLAAEVAESKASRSRNKMDDVLVPLFRKAGKIFVVAVGVVYVAQSLNMPIGPFLASLSIGSLAFAFAAKDTVENFFGSVAVILDRPFNIGDWVVIGDVEGTVEEVGFRSTRIRTFYDSQVTVANSTLVRATVDNFGRRQYRRWKCHLGLEYGTPPDKITAFCEGIRELVRVHPGTRKDS